MKDIETMNLRREKLALERRLDDLNQREQMTEDAIKRAIIETEKKERKWFGQKVMFL